MRGAEHPEEATHRVGIGSSNVAIVVVHGCREDFGAAFARPQPNAKTTVHFVWGANGHE